MNFQEMNVHMSRLGSTPACPKLKAQLSMSLEACHDPWDSLLHPAWTIQSWRHLNCLIEVKQHVEMCSNWNSQPVDWWMKLLDGWRVCLQCAGAQRTWSSGRMPDSQWIKRPNASKSEVESQMFTPDTAWTCNLVSKIWHRWGVNEQLLFPKFTNHLEAILKVRKPNCWLVVVIIIWPKYSFAEVWTVFMILKNNLGMRPQVPNGDETSNNSQNEPRYIV